MRIQGHKKLSIVVPCYNEEAVLQSLYQRLTTVCRDITDDYEIVLVNDGSKDRTWLIMDQLAKNDSSLVCVNLSRNFGHQLALAAGLAESTGANVLCIDADLQDPPELLPRMLKLMEEKNADVVYGSRVIRDGEPWLKKTLTYFYYRGLRWISDIEIPPDAGDFRLLSRRVVDGVVSMPEKHPYIRGLVSWLGYKQIPLEYHRQPREAGKSNYNMARLVRLGLDGITGFSTKPLTLAFRFGVVCMFAAVVLCAISCWNWFTFGTASGLMFLSSIILLLSGSQFLSIGILGEYLGRMTTDLRNRPLYIIDKVAKYEESRIREAA